MSNAVLVGEASQYSDNSPASNRTAGVTSQANKSASGESAQSPEQSAASIPVMTNSDILRMVKAGISSGTILLAIQKASNTHFETTSEALIGLKQQGVSDEVLAAMMTSGNRASARANQDTPPAGSAVSSVSHEASGANLPSEKAANLTEKNGSPGTMHLRLARYVAGWTNYHDGVLTVGGGAIHFDPNDGNSKYFLSLALSDVAEVRPDFKMGRLIIRSDKGKFEFPGIDSRGHWTIGGDIGAAVDAINKALAATATSVSPSSAVSTNNQLVPYALVMDLNSDQINEAISKGITQPGQVQGLHLADNFSKFAQAIGELGASQGALQPGTGVSASGFQVVIYTPLAWIAEKASDAAKLGHNFTQQNVTPDMLRPVLRVIAVPSAPPQTGPSLGFDVSSVGNVEIIDSSGKRVLSPTTRSPFAFQGLSGLIAEFSLSDLAKLREKNPEFAVMVLGDGVNPKEFKVKKKYFSQLQ